MKRAITIDIAALRPDGHSGTCGPGSHSGCYKTLLKRITGRKHEEGPPLCERRAIQNGLVAVVLWLIRPSNIHTQVLSLLLGELGQTNTKRIKVQARNHFIKVLWKYVHTKWILIKLGEELDLSKHLVGERVTHHE